MREIAEKVCVREQPQRVLGPLQEGTRVTVIRLYG